MAAGRRKEQQKHKKNVKQQKSVKKTKTCKQYIQKNIKDEQKSQHWKEKGENFNTSIVGIHGKGGDKNEKRKRKTQ